MHTVAATCDCCSKTLPAWQANKRVPLVYRSWELGTILPRPCYTATHCGLACAKCTHVDCKTNAMCAHHLNQQPSQVISQPSPIPDYETQPLCSVMCATHTRIRKRAAECWPKPGEPIPAQAANHNSHKGNDADSLVCHILTVTLRSSPPPTQGPAKQCPSVQGGLVTDT